MTRAERRAKAALHKRRATGYYGPYPRMTDPRAIGIAARTPQQCSDCCGNQRKWDGPTRQERRAALEGTQV